MEERWIDLSLGKLPYLTGGQGKKMLFLHGGVATPHAYIPLFEKLSSLYEIYAPTHPGHGKSIHISNNWTIEDYINIYKEFLDKINIDPQVMIGHSFGGALALLLAPDYPQSKVIVFDGAGLPLNLQVNEYFAFMVNEAKTLIAKRTELPFVTDILSKIESLADTVTRHPEDLPWMAKNVLSMDISKKLTGITNQVSLYWGEDDLIVKPEIGRNMSKILRNSTFEIISGKGHTYPAIDIDLTYNLIVKADSK